MEPNSPNKKSKEELKAIRPIYPTNPEIIEIFSKKESLFLILFTEFTFFNLYFYFVRLSF